jgi:hypothetical protein
MLFLLASRGFPDHRPEPSAYRRLPMTCCADASLPTASRRIFLHVIPLWPRSPAFLILTSAHLAPDRKPCNAAEQHWQIPIGLVQYRPGYGEPLLLGSQYQRVSRIREIVQFGLCVRLRLRNCASYTTQGRRRVSFGAIWGRCPKNRSFEGSFLRADLPFDPAPSQSPTPRTESASPSDAAPGRVASPSICPTSPSVSIPGRPPPTQQTIMIT